MIKDYFTNRTFSIDVDNKFSSPQPLVYGVPQGSLLGPLFYILYTKQIEHIVTQHGMQVHLYADDCQIYISFKPHSINIAENKIKACLSDIKKWMDRSYLKLNPSKTKLILLSSKVNSYSNLSINLNFNNHDVHPLETVVSLGVRLSNNLDFTKIWNRIKDIVGKAKLIQ